MEDTKWGSEVVLIEYLWVTLSLFLKSRGSLGVGRREAITLRMYGEELGKKSEMQAYVQKESKDKTECAEASPDEEDIWTKTSFSRTGINQVRCRVTDSKVSVKSGDVEPSRSYGKGEEQIKY